MSKMQDSMQAELDDLRTKLVGAREKAAVANNNVAAMEREERALQAALDILSGKEPSPEPAPIDAELLKTLCAALPFTSVAEAQRAAKNTDDIKAKALVNVKPEHEIVFHAPEGWTEGTLNGEKILLEPGTCVMKNSFGEEVIAKIGTVFPRMTEPVVPQGGSVLPPITGDYETFSDAELLDG